MIIYSFAPEAGREIEKFDSRGAKISPVLRGVADDLHVSCIRIEPAGIIGSHEAPSDQLFIVVQGGGSVSGGDSRAVAIKAGCAAFWQQGEVHQTRAGEDGLTAIVVEGQKLDPAEVMKKV